MSKMEPTVPYHFFAGKADDMIRDMIRLRREFDMRRFLITAPNIGVRITGYPDDEEYRKIGGTILNVKEQVAEYGIEVGWWCAPSLTSGNSPYQHIVDCIGNVSPVTTCPLDEEFIRDFSRKISLVAGIAKPYMILFEDDYELSCHPVTKSGCFCPFHLEEFSKRCGRRFEREELAGILKEKSPEGYALRRKFAEMSRDTLVAFAKRVRTEVDSVFPECRLTLCQSGWSDQDGDFTKHVARAFAGKKTRPMVRIYGAQYSSSDCGQSLPGVLSHTMYSAEHLPKEIELLHETDTYPHTRYFASGRFMECLLYGSLAAGVDDTLFYGTQYLDNPVEESGYFEMYRENEAKLNAFKSAVKGCELDGIQIVYRPGVFQVFPLGESWKGFDDIYSAAVFAGCLGFPYTTRERKVKLLSGAIASALTDSEMKKILSGSVLVDAESAHIISERGFGELLGVKVAAVSEYVFSQEMIVTSAGIGKSKGKQIYNLAFAAAGSESASFINPVPEGAEVLTEYQDPAGNSVQAGLTRFVNRLGGRVAVMASRLTGNRSSNLFSYRKKEVLRNLFSWLNDDLPLPAVAVNAPNAWLLFLKKSDDGYGLVQLTNLSADTLLNAEIAFSPDWMPEKIEELMLDGLWKPLEFRRENSIVILSGECHYMVPRIFRIKR